MKLSPEVQKGIEAAAATATQTEGAQPTGPDPQAPEPVTPGSTGGQPQVEGATTPTQPQQAEGTQPQPAEGEPEVELSEDDVPTEYFGQDLSGIEPKVRQQIIDEFKERDRHINRLMGERKAEEQNPQPQVQQPQQPEPVAALSDEDLMRQFGISPDDPLYEVKSETMLPLARVVNQQHELLTEMANRQFMRDVVDQWNTDLDDLVGTYGELPEGITRNDVMEYAVKENITSPAEAYFKVVGPAQKELAARVKEARAAVLERRTPPEGTLRPKSTSPTDEKELTGMKVRDAVKLAAERAAESTGFDWAEAVAAANQQR